MKNKLLTILLSFAVALGLWLYVVTVVSPNSDKHYYNVPVAIQGEALLQERGLMITSTAQTSVSLHLEGNRTDLDKLNSSNITINVDVSRIYEAGTHHLSYTPTYPGDVPNNAISVLSKDPGTITVYVEDRISKEVPVDIQYNGTLSDGFMADKENKVLDHENVNVTGPKSVIDQIAMARINVDLEGLSESVNGQFQYTLCNENGEGVDAAMVKTDVESVTLTLSILRVKEIELVVNVIDGGGATQKTSSITIDPQTILISGNENMLEDIEKLELGTINLGEMPGDEVLKFPIKLPESVTNETGVTEATVEVRFPDLGTKTLTVTNINAINVPQGMDAVLITKMLEISVRGPKDLVETITEEQVSVTVDFADEQLGTATVKAQIDINAEGVGTVGTYNVTATLKKKR